MEYNNLTLDQAAKQETSQLFVVNLRPDNVWLFQMSVDNEQAVLEIPNTWVPFDLTTSAPRDQLLRSPQLRSIHARNGFAIISNEDAEDFYRKNPAALTTLRAVLNRAGAVDLVEPTAKIKLQAPNKTVRTEVSEDSVQMNVLDSIAMLNSGDITPEDALTTLANIRLNSSDIEYVLANCKDAELRKYVASIVP